MTQVELRQLGLLDYGTCLQMQRELFEGLIADRRINADSEKGGYLILCSHPHVYTLGKSGKAQNLLIGEEFLRSIGAKMVHTDRGGDITYHGPGQIVGYPILDLGVIGMGLREYIESLEQAVIDTIACWGIKGERDKGATGVWIRQTGRPLRKICAIGVRSSHSVTMHGLALNVNTDLKYFSYINPCGFCDRETTSIAAECGREIDMQQVCSTLTSRFEEIMNVKIINNKSYADRKEMGYQGAG